MYLLPRYRRNQRSVRFFLPDRSPGQQNRDAEEDGREKKGVEEEVDSAVHSLVVQPKGRILTCSRAFCLQVR